MVLEKAVYGDTAMPHERGDLPAKIGGDHEPNYGTVTLLRWSGEWKISDQAFKQEN